MGLPPSLFLFYLSHRLRHHPFRFLIAGNRLRFFSPSNPKEEELCRKSWPGPIWDVGASIGKYTPLMAEANPNQPVFAFEPNLNSLYYLGYRTARFPNVTIVPGALTIDGKPIRTSYNPNFHAPPTGPMGMTFSVADMIARFGRPAFVKLDVEGLEYEMLGQCGELLRYTAIQVSWHFRESRVRPKLPFWELEERSVSHTLLTPREAAPAAR